MPISKGESHSIDDDGPSLPDLAPDTTQGAVYRFLLEAPAELHGAVTADATGDGFSDDDVEAWMETAVDPVESETEPDGEL